VGPALCKLACDDAEGKCFRRSARLDAFSHLRSPELDGAIAPKAGCAVFDIAGVAIQALALAEVADEVPILVRK